MPIFNNKTVMLTIIFMTANIFCTVDSTVDDTEKIDCLLELFSIAKSSLENAIKTYESEEKKRNSICENNPLICEDEDDKQKRKTDILLDAEELSEKLVENAEATSCPYDQILKGVLFFSELFEKSFDTEEFISNSSKDKYVNFWKKIQAYTERLSTDDIAAFRRIDVMSVDEFLLEEFKIQNSGEMMDETQKKTSESIMKKYQSFYAKWNEICDIYLKS